MKNLKDMFRKNRRAITWKPDGQYESILLEPSNKTEQTILVIPRSEVIQKEMVLTQMDGVRENLEAKIAQLLPYSPKEMAYSLAVDSSRGLLYAIPDQKIKEMLAFLAKSGLTIDEVVSEDQTLFWFFQDKAASGPVIVFDRTSERTLFLAFKENAILLSRAYSPEEEFKNILSEISFSLLESGIKPVKAFVSGSVDQQEIAKALEIPVEMFETEKLGGTSVSSVLLGAKKWGAYPVISLLPSDEKIQKRMRNKDRLLKESIIALGLMLLCFSFFAVSHLIFSQHKKILLTQEVAKLAPAASEIHHITDSLAKIHAAKYSKEKILLLLQELSGRLPSSVRLKELQVEGGNIVFQGESPSHALLTETVQVLEKIEGVKEAKLEHARLRKRLNQDFFDFEVTAQWQS